MTMARLAVELWKLLRAFERAVPLLPNEHQARSQAQLRFSAGRLESFLAESGLVLAVFDGRPFEPNLPLSAVNGDEYAGVDGLVVQQTIEPAIVCDGRVLLMGKVIIGKGGTDVSRD
jgi:hypothetical protein